MGLWASCRTEGTLCLALPYEGRAAGALLQLRPRPSQSLCAGDGYERSVPAWPCCSTVPPKGHVRLFGARARACVWDSRRARRPQGSGLLGLAPGRGLR